MRDWYDRLMRVAVTFTAAQIQALNAYAKRNGISRAEAVRRAVDRFLDSEEARRAIREDALEQAFGIWKYRGIDTDSFLAELRVDWDAREREFRGALPRRSPRCRCP